MPDSPLGQILQRLRSGDPEVAWALFLEQYAPLIYQTVRHLEPDGDRASDCFQFVCEQLIKDKFRRLKRYDPAGPASFQTWLRVVVRNLCLDLRRKEFGRLRDFSFVSRLTALDREVFRLFFERGESAEETLLSLAPHYPGLTAERVGESIERISKGLTAGQRWRLGARARPGQTEEASAAGTREKAHDEVRDPRPDPESQTLQRERQEELGRALRRLSKSEKILLSLRFEEGLTLEQVAVLLGLGNAQRADRQIKDVLARLRVELDPSPGKISGGKKPGPSVKVIGKRPA